MAKNFLFRFVGVSNFYVCYLLLLGANWMIAEGTRQEVKQAEGAQGVDIYLLTDLKLQKPKDHLPTVDQMNG